uniref:RNB domain-containing protein n=1 Tax=viral metagenome TaxID=1070528 RepID=A0A6C0D928_9ZZZZ
MIESYSTNTSDNIYKVQINDRGYTEWTYISMIDFKETEIPNLHPVEHKLFTNDVFSFDNESKKATILHSSIRLTNDIPGVIILKGNKTYGRAENGKLLYKCIPDDRRLPTFLISYEMKNVGFSKVFLDHYCTFNFIDWKDKHPRGVISQMIGPVDVLNNFYEYQLYCKSLNASIQKFTKDTSKALKNQSHNAFIDNISKKYPEIVDRTDKSIWYVFTIDPSNSLDYDDAFSIRDCENGIKQLSIYISNVTIWMDVLNLWDSFSRRISTIYLPDRKRPMLPTILSDCLCSLQSNHTRIAFVMDLFIDITTCDIKEIKYSNCKINVNKNYYYEEPNLLGDNKYQEIFEIVQKLSRKYKYINNVRNSHEMVGYLMILMNYNTAKELIQHKNGIFRSTIMKRDFLEPNNVPEDVGKFIKIWNSLAGQYIDASCLDSNKSFAHELLEMEAYIHITSPIRRLVDLLNIIKFQQNTGMINLSDNATTFYNEWLKELDYINTTMRSIRKVQSDCNLLHMCYNSPELMEKTYTGYVFDKIIRNDGLFQYVVYLPDLKLASRITFRENLDNYTERQYKLYLFHDEEKFKKKIRLQLIH